MTYSRITSIEVRNFMSYEVAKLSFDESGVINIKGYNDSGKSALLRAIMVCLGNINKTVQTKWIRDGADYFRIIISFDDGVSILRDKYKNGQSLYEMYKDGKLLFTTKQGNKLSKVDDVPEKLKAYIGLCESSFGFLNYQSCTDKSFLVETSGSENYAMLNEVLKTDEIIAAQKMMRYDLSSNNSKQSERRAEITTIRSRQVEYEGIDEGLVGSLKGKNTEFLSIADREEVLKNSLSQVEASMEIVVPPEVGGLDDDRLERVSSLKGLSDSFNEIKVAPEVKPLDQTKAKRISDIGQDLADYKGVTVPPEIGVVESDRYSSITAIGSLFGDWARIPEGIEVPLISSELNDKVSKLGEIRKVLATWAEAAKGYKDIAMGYKKAKGALSSCVESLEQRGVSVEICPNCGEAIVEGSAHVHY